MHSSEKGKEKEPKIKKSPPPPGNGHSRTRLLGKKLTAKEKRKLQADHPLKSKNTVPHRNLVNEAKNEAIKKGLK